MLLQNELGEGFQEQGKMFKKNFGQTARDRETTPLPPKITPPSREGGEGHHDSFAWTSNAGHESAIAKREEIKTGAIVFLQI